MIQGLLVDLWGGVGGYELADVQPYSFRKMVVALHAWERGLVESDDRL